jgi:DNA-binding MarR family transcriptional regulator
VNALITRGYVSSERDATDGRAYRITVTDAGTKVLTESHRRMVATFSRALEGWSTGEIAELAKRLDLLREDFSTSTYPTEGAPE